MTVVADPPAALPADGPGEPYPAESRASAAAGRFGVVALGAIAPAATLYLAFNNGGYFPNSVGLVSIVCCAALVLRITLADHPLDGYNRRLIIPLLCLASLALLQLASGLWSHAASRALDGFDRTFLYVLVFALYGSLPRTAKRLEWLARSLAAAMSGVALAGLLTRVLPHVFPTALGFYSSRLSYPLGYWNAVGLMAGLACILLFHLACSLRERPVIRVLSAALFPAVATTALLTYSRGALGVTIVGLALYAVLARPRGLLTGLIAIAPGTALSLRSGYDAVLLSSDRPTAPAAVTQGHHVAVTVGISMLLCAVLQAAALRLDPWLRRPHPAPPGLARIPRRRALAGAAVVVLVALVAIGAPGFASRQFNRFISVNSGPSATQVRDRLTDPASDGRVVLWQVALRQFRQHKLLGEGAGTYQTYFAQHRTDDAVVTDTHSLYLQTLGEDGLVGILLLVVVLVSVLGTLAARLRGPYRAVSAALFACAVAWAIHSAVDWDWQMPAVTLWLFAVAGLAIAARPVKATRAPSTLNRTALAACLLALAVAPLLIGFSYQRLRASGVAFVHGNCRVARQRALSSMSLLAVRPDAYEILGYCDLQLAYPAEGLEAMRKAVSYDGQNWNTHFGLALALAANGLDPRAEARRADALDPRNPITQTELRDFDTARPGQWPQAASVILLQGLQSQSLSVSNL